jgi:phosphoglycolate phosphatase
MKHWVFDFDGTLVDTDGVFSRALKHALEPFAIAVRDDFMEQIRHKHPHRIFEDLLPYDQAEKAMARMRQIGQELTMDVQAFAGIDKVLESLDRQRVTLSIWTGRDGESTRRILQKTGLAPFFQQVISGTCVPTNKPGHDGLLEIMNHYTAESDELIMVGDHHHDIEPANALGLWSVHAQWKSTPHVLPEKIKPNFRFGSVLQFHEWVIAQLKENKVK